MKRYPKATTGASRRGVLAGGLALSVSAAVPLWAGGGGGGGGDSGGTSGGSGTGTAPRDAKNVLPVRNFLRADLDEVKKMRDANFGGKRVYWIDGFSQDFTDHILWATVNHRRATRDLIRKMEGIRGTEKRRKALDDEFERQGRIHDQIRDSARQLRRDADAAKRRRNESDRAMQDYLDLKALSDEEAERLDRARAHLGFIRTWRRAPDEGTR